MNFENFLYFAREYSDLGWAVQEQLIDLVNGNYEFDSLNENAVKMIKKFAENLPSEIESEYLLDAIENYESLEEDE